MPAAHSAPCLPCNAKHGREQPYSAAQRSACLAVPCRNQTGRTHPLTNFAAPASPSRNIQRLKDTELFCAMPKQACLDGQGRALPDTDRTRNNKLKRTWTQRAMPASTNHAITRITIPRTAAPQRTTPRLACFANATPTSLIPQRTAERSLQSIDKALTGNDQHDRAQTRAD